MPVARAEKAETWRGGDNFVAGFEGGRPVEGMLSCTIWNILRSGQGTELCRPPGQPEGDPTWDENATSWHPDFRGSAAPAPAARDSVPMPPC